MLTADELLAGALTFEVRCRPTVASEGHTRWHDRLRPLTVSDLQLIARAARENDALASALMVQSALVEPKLTLPQVNACVACSFLLGRSIA